MTIHASTLTIRLTADEFWLRPSSLRASAGIAGFSARRLHDEHIQNCLGESCVWIWIWTRYMDIESEMEH